MLSSVLVCVVISVHTEAVVECGLLDCLVEW